MTDDMKSGEKHAIKLCHIVKWEDFDGYGFNLHGEKSKVGQYIGKVDEGSPAEAAGLKEGDRIIEVNGVNIANENHKQVVQRIKSIADETKLLVVDPIADLYFKSENIIIKSTLPNVVYIKSDRKNLPEKNENEDTNSNSSKTDSENKISISDQEKPQNGILTNDRRVSENDDEIDSEHSQMKLNNAQSEMKNGNGVNKAPATPSPKEIRETPLNLNMTAKELREKLASRKKYDPKKESMDFRMKYDIVQKL